MINIKEAINKDGFVIYKVKGQSMLPLFDSNKEIVRIEKIENAPSKYDVVLFRKDDKYILHRIIDIKDDTYYIVGDNQTHVDKVLLTDIIGKATGKYYKNNFTPLSGVFYDSYVKRICKDINSRKLVKEEKGTVKEYYDLLNLINARIRNEKYSIKGNQDMVLKLAIDQKIDAFCFAAVDKESTEEDIYENWQQLLTSNVKKDILYSSQREKVYQFFNSSKIKYMPLKGIIIRDYYPSNGIRCFVDNDILYDSNYFKEVKTFMENNGYTLTLPVLDDVDVYVKDDYYYFELHKNLFEKEYGDFREYFINCLKDENRISDTYECKMDYLNFYLYFLVHMYKHFENGGPALRFYIDLYYINKNILDKIDEKKLIDELKILNIEDFYNKSIEFTKQIFSYDYSDVEQINKALNHKIFGNLENYVKSRVSKQGKFGYLLSRLFPPIHKMDTRYPILKKCKFMLPIFWVVRLLEDLFSKKHLRRFRKEVEIIVKDK